jgi:8-oxo-dGTP pyrophosphatase MutT (NUDIX family)
MLTIPDDPGRHGVVAVVIREERFLVIRRAQRVVAPGAICFPGGGIDGRETEPEALVREIREELGTTIEPVRKLWESHTAWKVHLAWWLGRLPQDAVLQPNPAEIEAVYWYTAQELAKLPDLLPSNHEFLAALDAGVIALGGG